MTGLLRRSSEPGAAGLSSARPRARYAEGSSAVDGEGVRNSRLAQGEDDEVFNPALSLRMRDFGIEMPQN
jgi:hypothetical protein